MTERDWLSCTDPFEMLIFLGDRACVRKRQLFALACYERARVFLGRWGQMGLDVLRDAPEGEPWREDLERDEAWSDVENELASRFWKHGSKTGAIGRDEDLWDAVEAGREAALTDWADAGAVEAGATHVVTSEAVNDGYVLSLYGIHPSLRAAQLAQRIQENARSAGPGPLRVWQTRLRLFADFLRDLFGNPFRPVSLDPVWLAWNDGTIRKLARAIYEERAFDRLPILADALEEAGCAETEILNHCREATEHARGCWVLDLVLDRR